MNVGYVVARRAYTAVWRNRLRRLMREGFAPERKSLQDSLKHRSTSASIIFMFKPQALGQVRRLRLAPVSAEIAVLCRQLRELL
jgi:ribonuclease P protein component